MPAQLGSDMAKELLEIEICAAIARSGLFDEDYYLATYPDVEDSGLDPLLHYVRFGEAEMRNPSREFVVEMYKPLYRAPRNILFQHLQKLNERNF